ncbi:uncharacterized protein LOC134789152, partial [Penaeus indicus]|uniref:uncharacterized protein LOC134789152 n=1 Tax=Penaeus indicus TaxID=29960 RepID=UPI00300C4CE1
IQSAVQLLKEEMSEHSCKKARMEQPKPETRQDCLIFGLGAKITADDAEITGIRLPTNEQVLRCFRFHQMEGLSSNCSKRDIAKIVLEKLVPFYMKANIPMITTKKANCSERSTKTEGIRQKAKSLRKTAIHVLAGRACQQQRRYRRRGQPKYCRSSLRSDAPWNDLQLFKRMILYAAVNPHISQSSLTAFKRHMWYLTPEMVPLALFSDSVPNNERQGLAERLLTLKPDDTDSLPRNRFGTGFGKPKFPEDINENTTLADIVTEDSWYIFKLLDLNPDFLSKGVDDWETSDSYITSKSHVSSINVTNDCAERAVKLSADYASAARKEDNYQNILHVVESDRKCTPNLRNPKKKTL